MRRFNPWILVPLVVIVCGTAFFTLMPTIIDHYTNLLKTMCSGGVLAKDFNILAGDLGELRVSSYGPTQRELRLVEHPGGLFEWRLVAIKEMWFKSETRWYSITKTTVEGSPNRYVLVPYAFENGSRGPAGSAIEQWGYISIEGATFDFGECSVTGDTFLWRVRPLNLGAQE